MSETGFIQRSVTTALRIYIEREGISQRELARRLSRESSYVNRIITGRANLTLQTVEEIGERLGITLLYPAVGIRIKPAGAREMNIVTGDESNDYAYALAA